MSDFMKIWLTMLLGALTGFALVGMSLDSLIPPEARAYWAERHTGSTVPD